MTVTRRDFEDAVAAYWGAKQSQNELSKIKGKVGEGTAGSVRAGKQFDGIAALIAKFFLEAGYPADDIHINGDRLKLPGYYRPQKKWDVVVAHENTLIAAFELKALGGPSFGNNYNNRVEEALGSAVDLRRAHLEKLFPGDRKMWLGYFFIMEDADGSRSEVEIRDGAFPVEEFWYGKSYQERFAVFCERLIEEQKYDSVCFVTSSASEPKPVEPRESLDWRHFSAAVNAQIGYFKDLGLPKEKKKEDGEQQQLPL